MKRYNPEIAYPETRDEQLVMCQSDDGNWVPAEVAQALYDALKTYIIADESGNRTMEDIAMIHRIGCDALSLADGDTND